jgi:hypothetical protein
MLKRWLMTLPVLAALQGCADDDDSGDPKPAGGSGGSSAGGSSGAATGGGGGSGGGSGGSGGIASGGSAGSAAGGAGSAGETGAGGAAGSSGGAAGAAGDAGSSGNGGAGGAGGKLVFVTAQDVPGSFASGGGGAQAIADGFCQNEATAAGLGGRAWRAWISTGLSNAVDALSTVTGPWRRVDGQLVFNSAAEIAARGTPASAIDRDASGTAVDSKVWTGTNSNGEVGASHCLAWSSTSGSQFGIVGRSTSTTTTWTNLTVEYCTDSYRLYCFEI